MNLEELKHTWQQQPLPEANQATVTDRAIAFEKKTSRENTLLSTLFGGTIFCLGAIVIPFISDQPVPMVCVALLIFLMGFQAFIFWMRNVQVKKSMADQPALFIQSQIRKLRYHLMVTNLFMPLYMGLLGMTSSVYLLEVLKPLSDSLIFAGIGLMWGFYVWVFFYVWRKQRIKNQTEIIPLIEDLKRTLEAYL